MNKLHETPEQASLRKRIWFMRIFGGLIVLSVLKSCFDPATKNDTQTRQPTAHELVTSYPMTLDLPLDKKEAFGLLINMNQRLCAKVLEVTIVAPMQYEVECVLYRVGVETYRYMVNMKTGRVA